MTQKCHEGSVDIYTEEVAHLSHVDVRVKQGTCRLAATLNFDNLVIFAWLFRHKLRGCLIVQLARHTKYPGLTMLDFACS